MDPYSATRTERLVAHLQQPSSEGRAEIQAELDAPTSDADVVVLACTCFPLVGDVIRELNPDVLLLDPVEGVGILSGSKGREGRNRLTVALSGRVLSPKEVAAASRDLFPSWELEGIEESERLDGSPQRT